MINGRTFDWESIRVDAPFGLNLVILAIDYKSESPVEAVYGRGRVARGYSRGNLAQEGSFEMPHESFLQLGVEAAVYGGIFNITPFPIVVSYSNADQGIQIDVLPAVVLQSFETSASQGDSEVRKVKVAFKILDPIKVNGQDVL